MVKPYTVERYTSPSSPDRIRIYGEHGEIAFDCAVGPGGPLHPENADAAKSRPWFFTGSPFGPHLIGLAWERHGALPHGETK